MTPTPGSPGVPLPRRDPRRAAGRRPGSSRTSAARTPASCSTPTRPIGPGGTSSCTTAPRPPATTTRSTASTASCWDTTAAATTSSSATATAAATARSRSPSAGINQKQGVHCRNARSHDVDEYGIGICLVGDLDQQPPTPRQVAATQALVAYLSQRYRIEPARVTTHAHLAATPTVCPGKYLPGDHPAARGGPTSSGRSPARADRRVHGK